MPSPLSTNVTPAGSEPVDVSAGVGVPIVVTVKVPALPTGRSSTTRSRSAARQAHPGRADEHGRFRAEREAKAGQHV